MLVIIKILIFRVDLINRHPLSRPPSPPPSTCSSYNIVFFSQSPLSPSISHQAPSRHQLPLHPCSASSRGRVPEGLPRHQGRWMPSYGGHRRRPQTVGAEYPPLHRRLHQPLQITALHHRRTLERSGPAGSVPRW